METLECGHPALAGSRRVCRHLLVDEPPSYVGLLTGVGVNYDIACLPCADDAERTLLRVCEGCLERAQDWDRMIGWRGAPEIRVRDQAVAGDWVAFECPSPPVNDRCVAGIPEGWVLVSGHRLVVLTGSGEVAAQWPLVLKPEPPKEWAGHVRGPALHTSPDGHFAAVVTDYGEFGQVVDLRTGDRTCVLDRGTYHNETTPFPVCFVMMGGSTIVVAATAWNRLDAFDAASGELLTPRAIEWSKGQPRPEHHLDYFHGGLLASPHGNWILDDGWVWHPVGVPMVIDAQAWLGADVYAAEHGSALSYRNYAWDQPSAWVDNNTVAIQRIGYDDEAMLPGVQLFDADTRRVAATFAGPSGPMWAYRGRLYVAGAEGMEIWDGETGTRVGLLADFTALAQNPETGALAQIGDEICRTWTPD